MARDEEVAVVDPKTGGVKGSKLCQIGSIDPRALIELARTSGYGTQKRSRFNYLRGYAWHLSYEAAQRHLMEFWAGEDLISDDPQAVPLRLYHLAAAAWHCLALLSFTIRGIGTDDRPHRYLESLEKAPGSPQDASSSPGEPTPAPRDSEGF